MSGSLANCRHCEKAFSDFTGRGLCPSCYGQKVFGKQAPPTVPAPEPIYASEMGLHSHDHTLRCDVYAQKGRAHEPAVRRGVGNFW